MDAVAPIGILRPVPIVLGPQHVLQPPPVRACPGCGRGNVGWHGFNLSTLCADCLSVLRPEQGVSRPASAHPFLLNSAATADTAALLVAAAAAATGARVPASPAADEPVARSDNPTSPRQPVAPWTEQEDAAIRAGVLQHGTKWRNFPLPGRSTDAVRNRWGRLKERDTADAGLGGEGAAGWDHASQEAPSRGMATASDVPAPASDADPVEVRSTVSRAKKGAPILKATAPAAAHGRNLRKRLR
ncbi:hypothetical protein EMIHUDRAFT_242472 [Emiliania huxleyi CCMP1516]|uniref:Myb-like domain-containing protein n=2 Tax=Emiliania huxleyi TaxID=2903 RepID=A0A0D3J8M1_EMIH1|nr:hypothetical protein EMIHUDRAFT_242472 [Emiliania huxleyi CCMP1516]EOD19856.1 hypothetical protein EMIHUDRAFT_242472 [Emiliania huxleyi CCMP1516]|eukprot:XP_005772285.1 hypothetical protein EMIHUDRAFT_242472 [Emiliania huxleyi CCMP1516]